MSVDSESPLFEPILVAMDPAGLAVDAVVQGATLAKSLSARVEYVLAVPVPPALWPGVDEHELARMHAGGLARARDKAMVAMRASLEEAGADVHTIDLLRVLPGHPVRVILERAKEIGAELLILGPHEKRGLLDFGSTARGILSAAPCPVWVQPQPVRPLKEIVVPVDFSPASRRALEIAWRLAHGTGARIHVLHVYEPPALAYPTAMEAWPAEVAGVIDQERVSLQDELDAWVRSIPWGGVEYGSRFFEGDAVEGIVRAAQDRDLVVMGTHGRSRLASLVMGSVAYGVLRQSDAPVLVVPPPRET